MRYLIRPCRRLLRARPRAYLELGENGGAETPHMIRTSGHAAPSGREPQATTALRPADYASGCGRTHAPRGKRTIPLFTHSLAHAAPETPTRGGLLFAARAQAFHANRTCVEYDHLCKFYTGLEHACIKNIRFYFGFHRCEK